MQRAVVSIGIRKTGGLPELMAAQSSAASFAEWAEKDQEIPADRIKLITDEKGKVGRERIFDEVDQLLQLGFVEQLIIYFSGHGINSGHYEQWLLSRAPDDPGAAVNVRGSEALARFCGVSHVVFVSDACRTAADSIQAQSITGGEIFSSPSWRGPENPVDQYFATLVGNPAYEVKLVEDAVKSYRAAYSTVLMKALKGEAPSLVEDRGGLRLIRPRPLKRYLAQAVPEYMSSLGLEGGLTQQPDARIVSDEMAWISELKSAAPSMTRPVHVAAKRAGAPRRTVVRGAGVGDAAAVDEDASLPPPRVLGSMSFRGADLELQARDKLAEILTPIPSSSKRSAMRGTNGLGASALLDRAIAERRTAFGPDHFETQCGLKIRGARMDDAVSRQAEVNIGGRSDVIQIKVKSGYAGADVLIRLEDRTAVVVPVIKGYITSLTFDAEGNLDDLSCEPSANAALYREWQLVAKEANQLRALVGAASSFGVFRFDDPSHGAAMLARMQALQLMDPIMAVYVAWAFHDRRMRAQIVAMQQHLDRALGLRLFDVAMLSFTLGSKPADGAPTERYPCVPMLTQGWSLLSAMEVKLPEHLAPLRSQLRPSLWTHFAPGAYERLVAHFC
ncbi:hypothetical protein [Pseudorhodoferax sp.]|uniref:hypothetical protein n=1 Tax=Pseudorhodoferax sp. TaxID=1993553 RepID=UPI0039E29040